MREDIEKIINEELAKLEKQEEEDTKPVQKKDDANGE